MIQTDTAPKPRHNVELVLIVLALAVGIGASALVSINSDSGLDSDFWFQSSLLAVAAFAFHVVLRLRAKYADPQFLRGRTPAEVVYDEKMREDDIRPCVRTFGRWDWATARSPGRMASALRRLGVPVGRE